MGDMMKTHLQIQIEALETLADCLEHKGQKMLCQAIIGELKIVEKEQCMTHAKLADIVRVHGNLIEVDTLTQLVGADWVNKGFDNGTIVYGKDADTIMLGKGYQ